MITIEPPSQKKKIPLQGQITLTLFRLFYNNLELQISRYLNPNVRKDNILLLEVLKYNKIFPLTPRSLKGKWGYNSKHS